MTTTTTTMKQIKDALSSGTHTGDIVWWALRDTEIDGATFAAAWKAAGLDEGWLASVVGPARMLKKCSEDALRAANKSGPVKPGAAAPPSLLLRPVGRKDNRAIFALVREEHDGTTERNAYTHLAQLAVEEDTGQFLTDQPKMAEVLAISALYEARRGRMFAGEVAGSILTAIDAMGGISLRGSGGVYWVPSVHAGKIRALKEVVDNVGGSRFDVLPVHDSQEGNRALAEAARNSLEAKVVALTQEMDGWVADGKARAKTLEARLTEYDRLKALASEYATTLSAKVDDLLAGMDKLRAEAIRLLDEREDEKVDAARAPAEQHVEPAEAAG